MIPKTQIHLIEVGCYLGGTSTTAQTIGTGVKTWALSPGSPIPTEGMTLRAIQTGSPSVFMEGLVLAASAASVTINVETTGGSGSVSAWTFTDGVLRYTNGREYVHPSAPGWYEPKVKLTVRGSQSIFGDGRTFGAASIGVASIRLVNVNGGRDRLRTYGFFGRRTRVLVGESAAAYGDFAVMLTGTVEQPVVSQDDVLLRFRDRLAELQKPVQAVRYLGTNVKPDGVEGQPEDIAGRFKPLLRGYVFNFQPVLANEPKGIYQISVRQIHGIGWVKDGGTPVTTGVQHSSLASLVGSTKTFSIAGPPTTSITCTGHAFTTGSMVSISTTGTPPSPLVQSSFYWVRSTGTDTISLHSSSADAVAGSNAISITTTGAGTHSIFSMPSPGTYDYYLGNDATGEGSYIRLGFRPGHAITVEAWEGATAADRYPGRLWQRILLQDAGISSSDINSADVAALDATAPYEAGVYIVGGGSEEDLAQPVAPGANGEVQGAVSVKDALDRLCPAGSLWYSADTDGIFRVGQVRPPSGTPVATFTKFAVGLVAGPSDFDTVAVELLATQDAGRGVPLCRVGVKYRPNYTVQNVGDLGGDKTSPTDPVGGLVVREVLKRQYQLVYYPAAQDVGVLAKFGVALEQTWETCLRNQADAQALVQSLFGIYGTLRDRIKLKTKLKPEMVPATRLGAVVQVRLPRYGLDNGKLFTVLGVEYQPEAGLVTLDLWGAAT